MLWRILHRCYLGLLYFGGGNFRHPVCANIFVSKFSDDRHNRRVFNPCRSVKFTCRPAVVIPNQCINLVLVLRHWRGWSAAALYVTNVLSSPHSKRRAQPVTDLISVTSSTHKLHRCLWTAMGLQTSAVRDSVTNLRSLRPPTSVILYCDYVAYTWLTAATMVLLWQDGGAVRWVGQETLLGATFKRGK